MKKVKIRAIVLTTIFSFVVCSSMAQTSEKKEAIKYAGSINFDVLSENFDDIRLKNLEGIPPENLCYIVPIAIYIRSIDGFERGINNAETLTVVDSGNHQLIVERGGRNSITTTIHFDFEAGKSYTIYFSPKTNNFHVELITDKNMISQLQDAMKIYIANIESRKEKLEADIKERKNYLSYQEANPNRLNGTWKGEGKRLLTTFLNQYSFDGSRMKFEGESKKPKQTFVVEGEMMYNENTIIFFPERAIHKGKEVKNFNKRADRAMYIWYYTLADNELQLEECSHFFIGTQSWVNTGNFQKID